MAKVSIVNTYSTSIRDCLNRSVELIGGWDRFVKRGDRVLIKPNIFIKGDYRSGKITHPELILSVCKALWEIGAKVFICERTNNIYENLKDYPEILKYARIISLEELPCKNTTLKNAISLKISLPIPEIINDCDVFINMPSIRTHALTKISNSLKNIMGILPDTAAFHLHQCGLHRSIVELNQYRKSDLIISDGTYSLQGDFPPFGEPLKSNIIISGDNPVAVDAVTAKVIGFEPEEVKHIKIAFKQGLGPISLKEIKLYGESIETIKKTVKFKKAISNIDNLKDKFIFYTGGICMDCIPSAASGLIATLEQKWIKNIDTRDIAIVIGSSGELPVINEKNIILFGNCTYPYIDIGNYIPGCPPQATMIFEEIKKLCSN